MLTENEDFKQELWIYYLEGNKPESFVLYLRQLQQKLLELDVIDCSANELVSCPISEDLLEAINKMAAFRRSVALLMLLGHTAEEISAIKDLSLARTTNMMNAIMNNKIIKSIKDFIC